MFKAYRYEYSDPDRDSRRGPFTSASTDITDFVDERTQSKHTDPLTDYEFLEAMCERLGYDRGERINFRKKEMADAFYEIVNSDRWFFAFSTMRDCLNWFPPKYFTHLKNDGFSLFEYDLKDHEIIVGSDQCVICHSVPPTRDIAEIDDCFAILERELMGQ